MNDTLQIYEQIEAIKASIGFNSTNDKSEQWIQRQNLQDLYHQAILGDIDFTIDKKLEQDLWNFVFKNQINHFQTQIKDKKNAKRPEAQANLFFFLEAARGFYTKLLQDIVLTYDLELPFCKNYNFLSNNCFNQSTKLNTSSNSSNNDGGEKTKEKQLMYICQHILTHLGDIARYANMFDQAKSYYLHAIKLVPYLGHPYNQIGILFETSRTNQLSTVFYYIRSIAVRYTFPLAATNLENFFQKLVEIPLSRYPSDITKLTHKDYIQLFLQINALIYTSTSQQNLNKIQPYLDLFKTIANSSLNSASTPTGIVATTFAFEKFDSVYLCQMMAILFFMLNRFTNNNSTSAIANQQFTTTLSLLVYLLDQCLSVSQKSLVASVANKSAFNDVNFILPGFYLAFSYLEQLNLTDENLFKAEYFKQNNNLWIDIAKLLNSFQIDQNLLVDVTTTENIFASNSFQLYSTHKDYPLNEERNLESFIPLKDCLKQFNFKKYFGNKNLLSESDELVLRKLRIVVCFERLIKSNKGFDCLTVAINKNNIFEFHAKSELINSASSASIIAKSQPTVVTSILPNSNVTVPPVMLTTASSDVTISPSAVVQPVPNEVGNRKKRQNVAISSLTRNQQVQAPILLPQAQPPPQQQQQPQQHPMKEVVNPMLFNSNNNHQSVLQNNSNHVYPQMNSNFTEPNYPKSHHHYQQMHLQQQQQQQHLTKNPLHRNALLNQGSNDLNLWVQNTTKQPQPPQQPQPPPFPSFNAQNQFNLIPNPPMFNNNIPGANAPLLNKPSQQDQFFQQNLLNQQRQLQSQQQQYMPRSNLPQQQLYQQNHQQQQQQQQQQQISSFPKFLPDTLKASNFPLPQTMKNQYQLNQQQNNFQLNNDNQNQLQNLKQSQQFQLKQQQHQHIQPNLNIGMNQQLPPQQQSQKLSNFIDGNSNSSNYNVFPSFFENPKATMPYQQSMNTTSIAANSLLDNINTQSVYSSFNNIWSNGYGTNSNTNLLKSNKLTTESASTSSTSSSAVTPTPYQPNQATNSASNEDFNLNLDFNSNNYLSQNLFWPLNESNRLNDQMINNPVASNNNSINNNNMINSDLLNNSNLIKSQIKSYNNGNINKNNDLSNNILSTIWSSNFGPQNIIDNNNEPS